MLIKNITFNLEHITDIKYGNTDVFIELENGYSYSLLVATTKNIDYLMNKDKSNYFEPCCLTAIVKELTEEVIMETVKAYVLENAYWLRLHTFSNYLDTSIFEKLETENMAFLKEIEELDNS